MGTIRIPLPAKLFFGMLSPDPELFSLTIDKICAKYGPLDLQSPPMPWEISDYYQDEMGQGIFRKFVFLENLIDPGMLSEVKIAAAGIEEQFSIRTKSGTCRRINIDPGYITEAKVVLASTKDFSHRVYIGNGIYAEVTLSYSTKLRSFTTLEHTYFDFRTENYRKLFNEARGLLREQMKS